MANINGLFLANLAEVPIRVKHRVFQHSVTQGYPMRDHIDVHHPLIELDDMIDWAAINRGVAKPFLAKPGRPILGHWLVQDILYMVNPLSERRFLRFPVLGTTE